jgi:hypothetical protein
MCALRVGRLAEFDFSNLPASPQYWCVDIRDGAIVVPKEYDALNRFQGLQNALKLLQDKKNELERNLDQLAEKINSL